MSLVGIAFPFLVVGGGLLFSGLGGFFDVQRLLQFFIFSVVLFCSVFSVGFFLRCKVFLFQVKSCEFYVTLLVLAWLSLVVTQSPFVPLSLLELIFFIVLVVVVSLVLAAAKRWVEFSWWFLGGVVLFFLFFYSFLSFDSLLFQKDFLHRRFIAYSFDNIRHFSDVAVGLMPLALLYIVSRPRPSVIAAVLCFLPLSFWWYLLFLSEGRAGILSLALAMVIALALFRQSAYWPVTTLFGSSLAGLAGWWFVNPLRKTVEGKEVIFHRDITSDSNRFDLWRTAIEYSLENFPFGIGPMQFAGDGRLSYAHAHNIIFNTAAEWGLPIALMLLALILYGCWKIYRRSRVIPDQDQPVYACLVMAFVGVIVNVQFAGAHIFPLSSLVMALAIGLVFGYRDSRQPLPERPVGPVPIQATLLWAGMMLMMAYLLHAGMELYWLSLDSRLICMQEIGRAYLYPRFWAQGRLECMQMVAPDHWLFWTWR
ncbi:O-antigen ligase family protein [Halomonas sp. MCCC 1A11062]|uniref:O-antigen ligase family protein n=1 Tax=Halomonas sp. MCCC 1A11062 TaxID=2733485 RepID=UPI001F4190FA|nr:O-antigen ligase family protein [Halomonas sp. MCCC 1A11062]MCE8038892.1 O-antigen ligase family protein [Halomonas sp. MCCC 1A11062]